jgi:hypothetical protein
VDGHRRSTSPAPPPPSSPTISTPRSPTTASPTPSWRWRRSYLLGSLPFHLATARQRMQLACATRCSGCRSATPPRCRPGVAELSVADVRAAARRHLRPDELVTVAVTTAAAARADFERAAIGATRVVAFDAY